MATASQTFWVVRRGHRAEEYEDAFASDDAAGRYAVADGATESCFAGLWARLLAEGFVRAAGAGVAPDPFSPSLAALQEQWCTALSGRRLSWYSEPAIERGAFATFLGLTVWEHEERGGEGEKGRGGDPAADRDSLVSPSPPLPLSPSTLPLSPSSLPRAYRWAAMAVGDACLFHTRDEALLQAFPLERAAQFDNVPKLVGSRMSAEALLGRRRQWSDGTGRAGDRLWMMTDALAQWCLGENEAGPGPWSALVSLLTAPRPAERFASWIEELRDSGRLKNDDVTLLAISLEAN